MILAQEPRWKRPPGMPKYRSEKQTIKMSTGLNRFRMGSNSGLLQWLVSTFWFHNKNFWLPDRLMAANANSLYGIGHIQKDYYLADVDWLPQLTLLHNLGDILSTEIIMCRNFETQITQNMLQIFTINICSISLFEWMNVEVFMVENDSYASSLVTHIVICWIPFNRHACKLRVGPKAEKKTPLSLVSE
jgi:hypothetical protein